MAKNSIRDYDNTSGNNTDIQSVDISEGCSPAGINNALREILADLADVNDGTVALTSPSADSMTVTGDLTVDTNTLKVDSTNNRVGIGTATPSRLATLSANSGNAILELERANTNTTGATGAISFTASDTHSVAAIDVIGDGDDEGGHIRFLTTSAASDNYYITSTTERMRIDSAGDVFIGRTSGNPGSTEFGARINSTGFTFVSRDVNGTSASLRVFGNAGEGRIMGDGDLQNTNNNYGAISDETLKQDIVDAASQWDDIKDIRVRKFRFKDNPEGALQIGVIAQELEASGMNGLVKNVILDDDGEDNEETVKSVKYSVLYMKAIKALQEAMERIETLETKVAALEAE